MLNLCGKAPINDRHARAGSSPMAADDDEPWLTRQLKREALHFAAGEGDLCRVKELLAEGYPINGFDDLSWTPLHHAARKHHLPILPYLTPPAPPVTSHDDERIAAPVLNP